MFVSWEGMKSGECKRKQGASYPMLGDGLGI